jgi:hypothetical protein
VSASFRSAAKFSATVERVRRDNRKSVRIAVQSNSTHWDAAGLRPQSNERPPRFATDISP